MLGIVDGTQFDIAVVTAAASVVVSGIAAVASILTNKRVGKPNGKGNVVEMNELQLKQHDSVMQALAVLDTRMTAHISDARAHGGELDRTADTAARH